MGYNKKKTIITSKYLILAEIINSKMLIDFKINLTLFYNKKNLPIR